MARTKVIKFNDFMSGDYKAKEKAHKKQVVKRAGKVTAASLVPMATGGGIGALSILMASRSAFASTGSVVPIAVEASAKEWMGEQTLSALAHALDPVVDILVALSFPVASVIIVGACFFFMLGNSEKAWSSIQNAGLGYVLIQVSPLILNVLKQVGSAV
jgi:hypothetical protein